MTNFNLNNDLNQSRADRISELQERLFNEYRQPITSLIEYLRSVNHPIVPSEHFTLRKLGSIMGMSHTAVQTNYLPSGQKSNSNRKNSNSKTISHKEVK